MVQENLEQNRRFSLGTKEIPTSTGLAGAPARQVGAPATGRDSLKRQGCRDVDTNTLSQGVI